jgi:hypothetical protein
VCEGALGRNVLIKKDIMRFLLRAGGANDLAPSDGPYMMAKSSRDIRHGKLSDIVTLIREFPNQETELEPAVKEHM